MLSTSLFKSSKCIGKIVRNKTTTFDRLSKAPRDAMDRFWTLNAKNKWKSQRLEPKQRIKHQNSIKNMLLFRRSQRSPWNITFCSKRKHIHNHRLKGFQEKTILPFMRVVKDFMQISVKEYSCIRRRVVTSLECIWSIHINPSPSSSILFARETSGKLLVCILSKSIQPELLSHFPLLAIWHLVSTSWWLLAVETSPTNLQPA